MLDHQLLIHLALFRFLQLRVILQGHSQNLLSEILLTGDAMD